MSAVTNGLGVAVGSAVESFFRLRPSRFCAPERLLLKRRLAGRGGVMRDMRVWGRLRRATGAVRLQNNI